MQDFMTSDRFAIWCEIDSGITGKRSGWMKRNGIPVTHATREAAEADAAAVSERMNGNPNLTASFHYTVRPYLEVLCECDHLSPPPCWRLSLRRLRLSL